MTIEPQTIAPQIRSAPLWDVREWLAYISWLPHQLPQRSLAGHAMVTRRLTGTSVKTIQFRKTTVALAAVLAVVIVIASARAHANPIREYPDPLRGPCDAIVGPDGFVYIEELLGNSIGRLDPETGEIVHFPLPTPGAVPGGMGIGPDGALWFTEVTANKIARMDLATNEITELDIPTPFAIASDIAAGPDGAMWFVETGPLAQKLGRIDVWTRVISEFPLPGTLLTGPRMSTLTTQIDPGVGMSMVFTEGLANKVGVFDVVTHKFVEYTSPTPLSTPGGAITTPDGAIWFSQITGHKLGRIDPHTRAITEYSVATLGNPAPFPGAIMLGADNAIWMVNGTLQGGDSISRFDLETHEVTVFETPTPASGPCHVDPGSPSVIWFGEFTAGKIGRLDLPVD